MWFCHRCVSIYAIYNRNNYLTCIICDEKNIVVRFVFDRLAFDLSIRRASIWSAWVSFNRSVMRCELIETGVIERHTYIYIHTRASTSGLPPMWHTWHALFNRHYSLKVSIRLFAFMCYYIYFISSLQFETVRLHHVGEKKRRKILGQTLTLLFTHVLTLRRKKNSTRKRGETTCVLTTH